jgi:hypothetical protein
MDKKDMQLLVEQYYKFIGVPKRMQSKILNTLSYCKEIRDTAYPMKDSLVTELQLVEFTARKEKDLIYINGSLILEDGCRHEVRTFEAYIIEDKEEGKTRVYMDITRIGVQDEPKMIRTSEDLIEEERNIIAITMYASGESSEEKTFSSEFPKNPSNDHVFKQKAKQIGAL